MSYADLVDLFYDALSAHDSEDQAFDDVDYVTDEALRLGFSVGDITDAYVEAERG